MVYAGLQLSFCIILDVQTKKLSHLPKKKKPKRQNPNKLKQQTNP